MSIKLYLQKEGTGLHFIFGLYYEFDVVSGSHYYLIIKLHEQREGQERRLEEPLLRRESDLVHYKLDLQICESCFASQADSLILLMM